MKFITILTHDAINRIKYSALVAFIFYVLPLTAAQTSGITSTSPQEYSVQRDDSSGLLTLSTPYYTIQHDLKRGGTISSIRLKHGKAMNLLVHPVTTRIQNESGMFFTDLKDSSARVNHRRDGMTEIVTVECKLVDDKGQASDIPVKTRFEYHWGYIKIHKEITSPAESCRVREVCPFSTILAPSLSDYGYREGTTEQEGAPAFSFGSNRWGKLRRQNPSDKSVNTPYVPRSMLFADAGVEGLEWFAGSDLWQWTLQLAQRRGQGQCLLQQSQEPAGLALSISPFFSTNATVILPKTCVFDYYIGIPIIEGHALRPWLHTSFNRNKGNWVSDEQVRNWADTGIQTVHCHNDGDYYNDGLFWRDGSYPPYPDMDKYNKVITDCHKVGIRVATYFSNKELHPSTKEFQEHGSEWGRENRDGKLRHNFYRGTNEFGAQMCLRSGWLDYLKLSIDRVLKNHPLDGVYYDWNVALYCCNGLHEGKKTGEIAAGHWDIDELLDLMEWTRRRVGPGGLVIVHNTTTPMYTMENFADYIVANEWGYGAWKEEGPGLSELPLEWSLVGARARGVISYGQLKAQSPKRLHRLFALEALLSGVTPWAASHEIIEMLPILKPLGEIGQYRFADWRNEAVSLEGARCASAIYSRPGESYILLGNLTKDPHEFRCIVQPKKLPYPLASPVSAAVFSQVNGTDKDSKQANKSELNVSQLTGEGVKVTIPADSAVLLHIR
ncbi:MAG: DUF6259 domain-containing protein [Kiritimatiellae bacterium]|nr:DUF6259 domain-containing protein [Kiritimatiellia bacterium]MDD5520176.1 DUF6259 domain-containing protein [Kiritimatiellia bacterium]